MEAERVLRPVKEIIDVITGARSGELTKLPATASTTDIINTLNAIVRRLNRSGD